MSISPPIRIGLVGCGQIADAHLQEARKLAGVCVAAVCDRHEPLARQAAARFDVPQVYTDLSRMLRESALDVLHVTTPPQSHKAIALEAIDAGVSVYVEKPFSVDAQEAEEIIIAARRAGRKVCVGHDQLFDPVWRQCRALYDGGELGQVSHVDAVIGYDLHGPFGQVLSSEPNHWVHRLPGGLFQNTISHAVYKVTEFLTDARPQVCALWRDAHGGGYPTDLRATLWGRSCSGSVVFTTRARPLQRVVRVYGSRRTVEVDFDGQVIRQYHAARLPGAFGKLEVPRRQAREARRAFWNNLRRFARSDIHYFAGMGSLFAHFYAAVQGREPDPISPEEIVRVTAIMDEIFASCRRNGSEPGVGVGVGVATAGSSRPAGFEVSDAATAGGGA